MSEFTFPADVLYHPEHTWVLINDDNTAVVGITDFAQDQLGEVAFVDLPSADDHFDVGEEFGSVESIKAVSSLYMPISGTVTEVNEGLEDAPEDVNTSPYKEGWMLRIALDADADKSQLLSHEDYAAKIR
ncbi:glycine cleavage system protein GcvH [Desulfovibrio sp. JC022]|uniref:glycine cleavage system protein GcvH n=1 Tax=Desulfovibrio sp. JC022 TaxID=2593642 RepID=UPI0013D387AA|nr:glycine cleavage system protein GcvH [Desulfovibrio sp. JC022]NDV22804.1 glycine cleavage system protein GcvH [Desulfovibrio sp. JC022]